MILKADEIANLLEKPPDDSHERLLVRPTPNFKQVRESGSASLDLRLGTWFVTLPRTRFTHLDLLDELKPGEGDATKLEKMHYVPFHRRFILHPKDFVLAVTLEWLRMPNKLAGYVVGRSSWGRRGLIIATAAGVHPGFTGCLTLELSNVGEVPIALVPGITICQIFFHRVEGRSLKIDQSVFFGSRKPSVGIIKRDEVGLRLAELPKP
ncbi:MAG: dCTP deaminase [Verrucomicrobia bacterium]|nr:dCTP deaminase [Verrucomicrobiota bacterium]